jgi:hypothetical protein
MNGAFTARTLAPRRLGDEEEYEVDEETEDIFPEVTFDPAVDLSGGDAFSVIFVHDRIAFAVSESLENVSSPLCTIAVGGRPVYAVYQSNTARSLLLKIVEIPDDGIATYLVRCILERISVKEAILLEALTAAQFCSDRCE